LAEGIGGIVEYVLRNIAMKIDDYTFIAPFALLQDKKSLDEMILGREVVFEQFDIEFRQAEERIIFKWRDKKL
jgi:hypothetical protein